MRTDQIYDADVINRINFAKYADLTPAEQLQLASDPDYRVRSALAMRKDLCSHTKEALLNDPSPHVVFDTMVLRSLLLTSST